MSDTVSGSQVPVWFSIRDATSCLSLMAALRPLRIRYSLQYGPAPITLTCGQAFRPNRPLITKSLDENEKPESEYRFEGRPEVAENIACHLRRDQEMINARLPILLQRLGLVGKLDSAIELPLKINTGTDEESWIVTAENETRRLRTLIEALIDTLGKEAFRRSELPQGWNTEHGWPLSPIRNYRDLVDRLELALGTWRESSRDEHDDKRIHRMKMRRFPYCRALVANAAIALEQWGVNCLPTNIAATATSIPDAIIGSGYLMDLRYSVAKVMEGCLADIIFWIRDHQVAEELQQYVATSRIEPLTQTELKLRKARQFIIENGPVQARPIAQHIKVSVERLRSYYLPILRTRGVRTIQGEGYVCDET